MLLRACTVMHHRIHQIVVRKPVTHSSAPRGPHFCSYYKFDVKKRNLFVNSILLGGEILCMSKVFSLKKQLCHLNEALNWNSRQHLSVTPIVRLLYFLESIIYGYNYEIQTWTGTIHKLTFIFLCVVIHINNSRVVPCGISCGTWLAQWFIQAAHTVAFVFEHERYIASAFHAAPLCAKTHIVSVAKISKLSCVYPTNQCDVIVNCACAALRNIWRFGFVGFKTKTKGKSTHVQLSMYTELRGRSSESCRNYLSVFCALSV